MCVGVSSIRRKARQSHIATETSFLNDIPCEDRVMSCGRIQKPFGSSILNRLAGEPKTNRNTNGSDPIANDRTTMLTARGVTPSKLGMNNIEKPKNAPATP